MVLDLLLIGLAIALEPFPLVAYVLILGADKGTMNGLAFILGWLACLVVVIAAVLSATGGTPPSPHTSPATATLAVKLAAGVALILLAIRRWQRMGRIRKQPAWMTRLDRLSPWASAGVAAFLQPWVLVSAGAATVVNARLTTAADYAVLAGFCVLATSSFLALGLYTAFAPAAAGNLLERLREWLDAHQDQVIIVVFLLLGFWLAGKSLYLLVA